MKHKSSRIVAFTFLYILIIFGIFVIQFTIGKTFSYNIGSITVSGRHETDEKGNTVPLLPLHVISNGLNFYITEQTPIIFEDAAGTKSNLKILSYKKTENSFTVEGSNEIFITFSSVPSQNIESVKISVSMPKNINNIYFPWKLTQTARLEREDNKIFLRYGKNKFVFNGGSGFENSKPENTFDSPHLILSNSKPIAFYELYKKSRTAVFESLYKEHLAGHETYNEIKANFRNSALNYFENTIDGKNYNEEILAAYIAEMNLIGQYEKAIQNAPAIIIPKDKRTHKSCTFYNNLLKTEKDLAATDNTKLQKIIEHIKQKDFSVFEEKSLLPYLIDRNKLNILSDLEKFFQAVNKDEIYASGAAGILEAAMDYSVYFPNKHNLFGDYFETCEKKLKNSLFSINGGMFISSDSKQIDTLRSFEIASILIRYADFSEGNTAWKYAGQMLYSSLLNLSGESASLPAFFEIQGNEDSGFGIMANDNVILNAEKLYPAVVYTNNFYPHEESMALHSEPGIWAWTSAEKITVTQNDAKNFSFRVRYPENGYHYIIIRGIRPFYKIQIHGIDFKTDQRFETYNSSGYVYNEASKTLLLKLKHKKQDEDIKLFLGKPPQPIITNTPENIDAENKSSEENTADIKREDNNNYQKNDENKSETEFLF